MLLGLRILCQLRTLEKNHMVAGTFDIVAKDACRLLRALFVRAVDAGPCSLIERSQFAHNPKCYARGAIPALKEHGFDGSWLEWFLKETETFHGEIMRSISSRSTDPLPKPRHVDTQGSPDETPFTSDLPSPLLPPLKYPKILYPNTVNVNQSILSFYVHNFVPRITQAATLAIAAANRAQGIKGEGEYDDDGNYGSAATIDVEILQAISKRTPLGKFVSESKFQSAPADFIPHIIDRNRTALEALITKPEVEKALLVRLRKKATLYARELDMQGEPVELQAEENKATVPNVSPNGKKGRFRVDVDAVEQLYEHYIIPLTKEVESCDWASGPRPETGLREPKSRLSSSKTTTIFIASYSDLSQESVPILAERRQKSCNSQPPDPVHPPRTQLSAVFAEFEPSRSPSNQSASSLLEARFVSSSPSQSALSTSPSPSFDNARLSSSYQPSPTMESIRTPTESPSDINPVRHISLGGDADSISPPTDRKERLLSTPVNISDSSKPKETLPIPSGQSAVGVAPQIVAPQTVNLPSTPNSTSQSVVVEASTTREQTSRGSGWFGTSGRSKAQTVQPSNPAVGGQPTRNQSSIKPMPELTSLAPKNVEPVVEATVVPPVNTDTAKISSTKPASTSSGWFSRTPQAKPETPSKVPEPKPVTIPEVQASKPTNPNPPISQPIPLPASSNPVQEATSSAAASPSQSSWFGGFRGRGAPQPGANPVSNELGITEPTGMIASGNSSVQPSPSSLSVDLPPDLPLTDSIIDESMMATVTPMTFAQAQAQNHSLKPAVPERVPSTTYNARTSRESIGYVAWVLIREVHLNIPLLGQAESKSSAHSPRSRRGLTPTPSGVNQRISNEVISIEVVPDPETIQSAQGSSAASIASSSLAYPPSASWWPFLGWSGAPRTASSEGSSNPPRLNTSDLGDIPPPAPSSVAGDSHIASSSGSIQEEPQQVTIVPPVPNSASWFGFWPWSAEGP
ncbi:14248_t:CDS:2, partial [Acaulospora colombiana]